MIESTLPFLAPSVSLDTEIEALAAEWVAPYDQVEHLMRTRDWVVHLDPTATVEMRVAAMTHDIERMFPGGPILRPADGDWDNPFYLFPHALRSAEAVGTWLGSLSPVSDQVSAAEVRRLVALHEVGGLRGADVVQAADSLSFLETLAELARGWVLAGTCSRDAAAGKLRYSVDRIRVAAAREPARQLLDRAMNQLLSEHPVAETRAGER